MKTQLSTFYSDRFEYRNREFHLPNTFYKLSWLTNRYSFFIKEYRNQINDNLRVDYSSLADDIYKLTFEIENDIKKCYTYCFQEANEKKAFILSFCLEQLKLHPDPNFFSWFEEEFESKSKQQIKLEILDFINTEMSVYDRLPSLEIAGPIVKFIDKQYLALRVNQNIDKIYEEINPGPSTTLYKVLTHFFQNPLLAFALSDKTVKYFVGVIEGRFEYDSSNIHGKKIKQLFRDKRSRTLFLLFLKYPFGKTDDLQSIIGSETKKKVDERIALLLDETVRTVSRYSGDEYTSLKKIKCSKHELKNLEKYKSSLDYPYNIQYLVELIPKCKVL